MLYLRSERFEKTDFLTGVYNREHGLQSMEKLFAEKEEFSLFIIDLNKFKLINDVYGHAVGDIILKEIGRRLKSLEREDLIFARLGGDEFAAIYQNVKEDSINGLGETIHKELEEHIVISESEFAMSASIGVARYPIDCENMEDLLKLADTAMYQAKKTGMKNRYLISEELSRKMAFGKKIESFFKNVNLEEELFLEYQPIFDFETGEMKSIEALVRWNHKKEGVIYPRDFIYVAEKIDRVKDITRWVFVNGLHQIKYWNEKYNTNYQISLNVADSCMNNKTFFVNLQYMLKEFKVKPEWLSIQLTEHCMYISPEYIRDILKSIDALGVEIHIDDFGTDRIILSDLKVMRVGAIKLAEKYIFEVANEETRSIMQSMIVLAHALGIKTIAEGIENKQQYTVLKGLGCDGFQGFYREKPMSKEAFEEKYLKNKKIQEG